MPPQQPSKPLKYWIIIFILLLYAIPTTFFMIKNLLPGNSAKLASTSQLQAPKGDAFYTNQIATVNGKITKVSGKTITVVNGNNQTATLELSDGVVVSDMQAPVIATASAQKKQIQTGKEALIVLNIIDDTYKVSSITYQLSTLPVTQTPPKETTSTTKKTATSSGVIAPVVPPVIPELPKPPTPVILKELPKP